MSQRTRCFSPVAEFNQATHNSSWFANRKIEFLFSDGQRNYYGVRDPDGIGNSDDFVVSKVILMDCEAQHRFNRRATRTVEENEDGI